MSGYVALLSLLAIGAVELCPTQTLAEDVATADREKWPERYVADYPTARQCCPPIRSTFAEVTQTMLVVRGHRFRQPPNGGYGLAVIDKVGDQNLLHVGADLGWYQTGEPVFAITDGVVRISRGPTLTDKLAPPDQRVMSWGNLIVIEHRFPKDEYVTAVYGHLALDRRVQVGDVVKAGQWIGNIGRKHANINGGFNPHLHFGLRKGRNAEPGAVVFSLDSERGRAAITLVAAGEMRSEVHVPREVRFPTRVSIGDDTFNLEETDGKVFVPSRLLWNLHRPHFAIVGYDLTTTNWEDPVKFLRRFQADTNPAPLQAVK